MRRLVPLAALAAALGVLRADAQGLGDAAAREKQRREQEQKKRGASGKVFTNDDLATTEGQTANPPSAAAGAPRASQPAADRDRKVVNRDEKNVERDHVRSAPARGDADASGGAAGGRSEGEWRDEAAQLRKSVSSAETESREFEQRVKRIFGELQLSTDTNQILRLRAEQQRAGEELESAQQRLAGARQALAAFEERARRAGVPAGWIR